MISDIDNAIRRVEGNGSVQVGTYFQEAKTLSLEVTRRRAELAILLETVKAIAYDNSHGLHNDPENMCHAHHADMAQDALRLAYNASGDTEKP